MARFSHGRDDNLDEDPIARKRLRTTLVAGTSDRRREEDEQVIEGAEGDDVEPEEDNDKDAEEEGESEYTGEQDDESAEDAPIAGGVDAAESGIVADVAGACRVGSITVTLTDPDVLDCPICFEALTVPVFQCENGHIACASCCTKISNKCPSCTCRIGYNRCLAIEKVIESVKISCQNVKYGCKEALVYSKKHEHEKACIHAPCSCPLDVCDFVDSSKNLYAHFAERHLNSAKKFYFNVPFPINLGNSQKYLVLQEQRGGMIFVLNHRSEHQGSAVNVVCIGSPQSNECRYDVKYKMDGHSSLEFRSCAESIPKWSADHPLKKYLLVPDHFIGSCSWIRLQLCIWSSPCPALDGFGFGFKWL